MEHLGRGGAALGLLVLSSELSARHGWLSIASGLGALVLLRGCPSCWTVGLFETLRTRPRPR